MLLMFLYSDQCGGFCVCNIMSRMSGHVYPQSFMILNVFTIMFDLVHMQSQSFQMIFQSLMTSYRRASRGREGRDEPLPSLSP